MMTPRLAKQIGYTFLFYSSEPLAKEPAHVHVESERGEMKVWLETLEIAECFGIPKHDQNKIIKIIKDNQEKFLSVWNEYKERGK